jgi:hypothetical protein
MLKKTLRPPFLLYFSWFLFILTSSIHLTRLLVSFFQFFIIAVAKEIVCLITSFCRSFYVLYYQQLHQ